MITFIIILVLCFVAINTIALCKAAGKADKALEKVFKDKHK